MTPPITNANVLQKKMGRQVGNLRKCTTNGRLLNLLRQHYISTHLLAEVQAAVEYGCGQDDFWLLHT